MDTENHLEKHLRTWKSGISEAGPHPEDYLLYSLACSGGIESADRDIARHVSLCPACLEKWANWRKAISDAEEAHQAEAGFFMAYGMLEAAASQGPREPITLQSRCGSFTLGLLPQADNPEKGLLTLDVAGQMAESLEGQRVKVRDRNGRILIQGPLRGGRIARTCERLSEIDLSTWTIDLTPEGEA